MTTRRLSMLQWLGLLGGGLTWAAQLLIGFGTTQAECSVGEMRWGIVNDTWQLSLLFVAGLVVVGAESAAAIVFVRTRDVGKDDPPPQGRLHFFATAALVANLLFLVVIVLSGIASTVGTLCRGG
jgi:hypothetical protein